MDGIRPEKDELALFIPTIAQKIGMNFKAR